MASPSHQFCIDGALNNVKYCEMLANDVIAALIIRWGVGNFSKLGPLPCCKGRPGTPQGHTGVQGFVAEGLGQQPEPEHPPDCHVWTHIAERAVP